MGWFAFAAEYMDRTWEKQRYWMDSPLTETPSVFMNRNGILQRDQPGAGNIVWSSDYPHSETSFPHSHRVIARDLEGVPQDDIRKIIAERARRVYSVGV